MTTQDMHREAFEKWFRDLNMRRLNPYSDVYEVPSVDLRWEGWKSAMKYRDEMEKGQ
jgi:hypothetical protein